MLMLASGRIHYSHEIKCHVCGQSTFSHHSMEARRIEATHLRDALERDFKHSIPNIPVGWAMSGRDKLFCSTCTTNTGSYS